MGVGIALGLLWLAVGTVLSPLLALGLLLSVAVAVAVVSRPVLGLYLLVPAVFFSPTFTVGSLPFRPIEIRVQDVLLVLVAVGLLVDVARNRRETLRLPSVAAPMSVLIGASTLAFLHGIFFQDVSTLQSLLYYLKFVEYLALFLLVATTIRTNRETYILIVVFFLGAFPVAASGIVQAAIHYGTSADLAVSGGGRARFAGAFAGPTVYGAFNALVLPLALAVTTDSKTDTWIRWLAGLVTFASAAALVSSGARGALIGGVVGVCAVLVVPGLAGRRSVSPAGAAAVVVGIASLGLLVAFVGEAVGLGPMERLATLFENPLSLPGVRERLAKWTSFLRGPFAANPLLGAGFATEPWYNSFYVRLLVEQGIVTFLAFGWTILVVLRGLFTLERTASGLYGAFALGAVGATIGFLATNLTAEMLVVARTAEPFWLVCGLALSVLVVSRSGPTGGVDSDQ